MSSVAHNTIHVQGGSEARTVDMSKHKEMGSGRPFASTVGIECLSNCTRRRWFSCDVVFLAAESRNSLLHRAMKRGIGLSMGIGALCCFQS